MLRSNHVVINIVRTELGYIVEPHNNKKIVPISKTKKSLSLKYPEDAQERIFMDDSQEEQFKPKKYNQRHSQKNTAKKRNTLQQRESKKNDSFELANDSAAPLINNDSQPPAESNYTPPNNQENSEQMVPVAPTAPAAPAAPQNLNKLRETPLPVSPALEWFKLEEIHPYEKQSLPEFFGTLGSYKTPQLYKKYRNFIYNTYRLSPEIYLTKIACRSALKGDASTIIRIHKFLESEGLINYGVGHSNSIDFVIPPFFKLPYSLEPKPSIQQFLPKKAQKVETVQENKPAQQQSETMNSGEGKQVEPKQIKHEQGEQTQSKSQQAQSSVADENKTDVQSTTDEGRFIFNSTSRALAKPLRSFCVKCGIACGLIWYTSKLGTSESCICEECYESITSETEKGEYSRMDIVKRIQTQGGTRANHPWKMQENEKLLQVFSKSDISWAQLNQRLGKRRTQDDILFQFLQFPIPNISVKEKTVKSELTPPDPTKVIRQLFRKSPYSHENHKLNFEGREELEILPIAPNLKHLILLKMKKFQTRMETFTLLQLLSDIEGEKYDVDGIKAQMRIQRYYEEDRLANQLQKSRNRENEAENKQEIQEDEDEDEDGNFNVMDIGHHVENNGAETKKFNQNSEEANVQDGVSSDSQSSSSSSSSSKEEQQEEAEIRELAVEGVLQDEDQLNMNNLQSDQVNQNEEKGSSESL